MMSRRHFTQLAGLATVAGALPAHAQGAGFKVESLRTISWDASKYNGWPTVARRANGDLLVVCSGGREQHVCPFGRVELMVSRDEGQTWGWPRVVLDSDLDDRDAGVMETPRGTLLITSFTSLAYEPAMAKMDTWPEARRLAWQAARDRLSPEARRAQLGQWMIRSEDGGLTWSARYPSLVNSPHGPIALADGRLLYAGKELWTGERNGVCESTDDGRTWRWLAEIPTRPGDDAKDGYHELHAVETGDGRAIVQIRNHSKANEGETLQCESADGGKTWTVPQPIGVWGLPSHLLRLRDGRLIMTYGHRRPPFGNQARLSADHGRTWSEPMVISGDGPGGDLGYPSTVELRDGRLLSVWYEVRPGSPRAVLRQAIWRV